jgi:pimeloyl-ACP methyl ester carboxylesterase
VTVQTAPTTGSVRWNGCDLYYEEAGDGVPILLIHPAGSTASTWGAAATELGLIGRVITYDRRGNARSGGETVRSVSTHTADAAALLECLRTPPAVVVGTSAGATIAIDLAVRRPDLLRAVVAHEAAWRFTRRLPSLSQVAALAKIGSLVLRGRQSDAAEALLRSAYTYRDGESAWDASPRSGGVPAGRAAEQRSPTSGTRSASIRPPPISPACAFLSCAATAREAPTACSGSPGRSPLPFPPREHTESKAPATQHRSTRQSTSSN